MHYTGSEAKSTPLHQRCAANHGDGKSLGKLLFSSPGCGPGNQDSFPICLVLSHLDAAGINKSKHQLWKECV